MKSILIIMFSLGLLFLSTPTVTAQSVFPNDIIIQPYIGAPNMKKWAFDVAQGGDEVDKSKGILHYGLTAEYVISSRFGLGFDAIFSPFSYTQEITQFNTNPNTGETTIVDDKYRFVENKFRLIARAFIHFNIDNPLWDIYISGGIGPNIIFSKVYQNGEYDNSSKMVYSTKYFPILEPTFPLAGRFCFGTRYFFNDFIGINFEFGIGGPPLLFGVNLRL